MHHPSLDSILMHDFETWLTAENTKVQVLKNCLKAESSLWLSVTVTKIFIWIEMWGKRKNMHCKHGCKQTWSDIEFQTVGNGRSPREYYELQRLWSCWVCGTLKFKGSWSSSSAVQFCNQASESLATCCRCFPKHITERRFERQTGKCFFFIIWDLHCDNNEVPLTIQRTPSQGNVTLTLPSSSEWEDCRVMWTRMRGALNAGIECVNIWLNTASSTASPEACQACFEFCCKTFNRRFF